MNNELNITHNMIKAYSKTDAQKYIEKCGFCVMNSKNIDSFIKCGVEAFNGYSIYNYFFKGKDYDKKVQVAIELLIKTTGEHGLLYADSEKVNGFAQWFPPGFSGNSLWLYIKSGGWKYVFMSDFIGTINRIDYAENYSFKRKSQLTNDEDIFLYNLAVKPSMQKKGIARKLVNPILDYAKSINRACYCETYDSENVKIYKHMGFKELPVTEIADTPLKHYPFIFK